MRTFALTVSLAACATITPAAGPKGGPRGLRASEHLELAEIEEQEARDRTTMPEQLISIGDSNRAQPIAMPWFRSSDTSAEHQRIARSHRAKAAELHAEYDKACADKSLEDAAVSPLVRYGIAGWPTANGVAFYLSAAAGTPAQLLSAVKCHRAFMMLAPSNMDDCPLDLPGLELEARGDVDGVVVSLTVKDNALIPELKRRTAHELEASQHKLSG